MVARENKAIRRTFHKRSFVKKAPRTRINEYIQAYQIRVIDEDGGQLGVMPPAKALEIARGKSLDLVEVAPLANPPVCKIIDFGKYQYRQSRQERQHKSKQKKFDIKKVRISVRTDKHDLEFKRKQAEKFLEKGNKVKIEINLKGREKAYQDLARKSLEEFTRSITTPNRLEQEIKRYPGGFNLIIIPST